MSFAKPVIKTAPRSFVTERGNRLPLPPVLVMILDVIYDEPESENVRQRPLEILYCVLGCNASAVWISAESFRKLTLNGVIQQ